MNLRTTLTLLSSLLCVALPRPASSQVPLATAVNNISSIENITIIPITILTGASVRIETINHSPECMSVLHLLDGTAEVAFGTGLSGGASRIDFTNFSFQTSFQLLVRAHDEKTPGTADVEVNGRIVASAVPVRGAFVVGMAASSGLPFTYETALVPSGAFDPILYALDSSGRIISVDDNSGVGLNARIINAPGVFDLLVGTALPSSQEGPVNLYANDIWLFSDSDFDGLGDMLERALGTCAGLPPGPGQNAACAQTSNAKDTDRDGLSDSIEIFGIDDLDAPQYLSRWGANPRHKDVFVEVDFRVTDGNPSNSLSPSEAEKAAEVFARGPAGQLENPDGVDGVALHMDIGVDPDPAQPELATIFGDWGGSGEGAGTVAAAAISSRASVRHGVFQYALANGRRTAPVGGQYLEFDGTTGVFCHELGHSLGLRHAGLEGTGDSNANPLYFSMMNYAYEADVDVGFSDGSRQGSINPSATNETDGVGGPYSIWTPAAGNYMRAVLRNPAAGVDWNWSGDLDTNLVRAPVTFIKGTGGGALHRNRAEVASVPAAATTPVLLRAFGNRLFAVFVDTQGKVRYSSSETSGPDAHGSCPGGQLLGDACTIWGPDHVVPLQEGALGVGAAFFSGRFVIAYRAELSNQVRILSAEGFSQDQLSRWSPDSPVPGALTVGAPHLAPIFVHGQFFRGSTTALGLFIRDATGVYRWYATADVNALPQLQTSRFPDGNAQGAPLVGTLSPTFITWPHFDEKWLGARHTIGVLPDSIGTLRFYQLDQRSNTWLERTNDILPDGLSTEGKPGLAFHVLRTSRGDPLSLDSNGIPRGQLWLSTTKNRNGHVARMSVSTPIVGSSSQFDAELVASARTGWFRDVWNKNSNSTGTALYEDRELSALKALRVRTDKSPDPTVNFYPLADGTFDSELQDSSDWNTMERGICLRIAGSGFCGL